MIIIGIDPGTTAMGFAVLKHAGGRDLAVVSLGEITAKAHWSRERRLVAIGTELEAVAMTVDNSEIVLVGLEAGFVKGQMGAIALGEARGVAKLVLGKRFGHEALREYQPATVKLRASGNGAAGKGALREAVAARLNHPPLLENSENVSDAAAVAITRAFDSALFV